MSGLYGPTETIAEAFGRRKAKASQGIGSIGGGLPPCANCETEPVDSPHDEMFCSEGCRAEYEGEDE